MKENGEKYEEIIPTEELRSINPWILLDFYESRIKFIQTIKKTEIYII